MTNNNSTEKEIAESILRRKILEDEYIILNNYSLITHRQISKNILEVHFGYDKEKTKYKYFISFLYEVRRHFFEIHKNNYSLIFYIKKEKIIVRRLALKFGFIFHGNQYITCQNGEKKYVSKFVMSYTNYIKHYPSALS